ncbi:MAG: hypothetical protein RR317_00150 [Bilophila sp.]
MITNRSRSPLFVPFFLALLGGLFSGWNAWDSASVPCLTAGCTLYQGFALGGVSLWWGGVIVFMLFAGIALVGQAGAGRLLSGFALTLDCALLLVMVLTLPCLACLLVAVMLALSYVAFGVAIEARNPVRGGAVRHMHLSPLLLIWGLLFFLSLGGVLRNEVTPWAIQAPVEAETAPVRVFFSPSCTACRQLVTSMSESDARKVTWCPVSEDEKDLAIILDLNKRLTVSATPIGTAFTQSLEAPALTLFDMFRPEVLSTQFRLWCNQARVITSGEGRLPFIEFTGIPSALLKSTATSRPVTAGQASPNLDPTLPIDLGESGSCGGSTTKNGAPCP